jgi:hypothetical protein
MASTKQKDKKPSTDPPGGPDHAARRLFRDEGCSGANEALQAILRRVVASI